MKTTRQRWVSRGGSVLLVVLAALVGAAAPAAGQSVLLTRIALGETSGSDCPTSYLDVATVAAEIGFDSGFGEICEFERLGCEGVPVGDFTPGATFDFDANSPFFAEVVAGLTDGSDENLYTARSFFDGDGKLLNGLANGGPESARLGISPDLIGYQIDFVRLVVNDFSLSDDPSCGGGGLKYSFLASWEFYVPIEQALGALAGAVRDLVDKSTLNSGQGNALLSKLKNALSRIENGNPNAAKNILNAFINQIEDLIADGVLPPSEGQSLIDAAQAAIDGL